MAEVIIGGSKYATAYVVEQDGDVYGPFMGSVEATVFAFERLEFPWTVRELYSPVGPS